jgi:hypothetical protein
MGAQKKRNILEDLGNSYHPTSREAEKALWMHKYILCLSGAERLQG